MAFISQFFSWTTGDTITSARLNGNITNIINGLDDGTDDINVASVQIGGTEVIDSSRNFTVGGTLTVTGASTLNGTLDVTSNKSGTPGTAGSYIKASAATFTDNNTAGSGTAAAYVHHGFAQPTLAASNSSVTTTDAATVYIANAPAAGTNMTITTAYSLWVDAGNTRLDGNLDLRADIDTTNQASDWDLLDNNASALSFDASGKAGIIAIVTTDGSEGVTMSGNLAVTGTLSSGALTITDLTATGNTILGNGGADTLTLNNGGGVVNTAGTWDTITIDDITINANTISSGGSSALTITALAGQVVSVESVTMDGGVVAGVTNLTMSGTLDLGTNTILDGSMTGNWDFGTGNLTTGGIIKLDVDGTAENAAGSLTMGAGNDAGIFFDGTDLVIITNGAGASGIKLDAEDDTVEILGSGVLQATFSTSGINLVSGDGYSIAGTSVLNATTLGTGVLTSSLTTVGALNSGSITSGFGTIDNGSSSITTTGTINVGTVDFGTNTITDGTMVGNWAFSSGNFTGVGTIGSGAITTTAELRLNFATDPFISFFDATGGSRNWAITNGSQSNGALSIMSSNAQGGDPIAAGTESIRLNGSGGTVTITPALSLSSTLSDGTATLSSGAWSGITTLTTTGAISSTGAAITGGTLAAEGVNTTITIKRTNNTVANGQILCTGSDDVTDYRIGFGQAAGSITFDTAGTTTALTLDGSQNATFAGTITDGTATLSSGAWSGITTLSTSSRVNIGNTTNLSLGGINPNLQLPGTTDNTASIAISRSIASAAAPFLFFNKSRNASPGSFTIVQDNDDLGRILFNADDGVDYNSTAAELRVEVDGTPGSNDMPGRMVFLTTADGAASSTEALRLDSSQNATFAGILLAADGAVGAPTFSFSNGTTTGMSLSGTNALSFSTNGTEALLINSGQDLAIRNDLIFSSVQGFLTLTAAASTLTISAGVVTAVRSLQDIDTESAAASDDLDTINGGVFGSILVISATNSARSVVVKDGTGNIFLDGSVDFTMDDIRDRLILIKDASNWLELSRSSNA